MNALNELQFLNLILTRNSKQLFDSALNLNIHVGDP